MNGGSFQLISPPEQTDSRGKRRDIDKEAENPLTGQPSPPSFGISPPSFGGGLFSTPEPEPDPEPPSGPKRGVDVPDSTLRKLDQNGNGKVTASELTGAAFDTDVSFDTITKLKGNTPIRYDSSSSAKPTPTPTPTPEPEPEPEPKEPKSSPDPVPMPRPEPITMPTPAPPGLTAEDLPADAGLVTQVEKALGTDVPEWVKALSKPFDALNPADKTRLQDLVAGKDAQTGRAVEEYREKNRSKPKKPPEPPEGPQFSTPHVIENPRESRLGGGGGLF